MCTHKFRRMFGRIIVIFLLFSISSYQWLVVNYILVFMFEGDIGRMAVPSLISLTEAVCDN